MKINISDTVTFLLDGKRPGVGEVVKLPAKLNALMDFTVLSYQIKLTSSCKEFPTGTIILVDPNEITSVSITNKAK